MIHISIRNKICFTLLLIICIFILLLKTAVDYRIKGLSKDKIFSHMKASVVAYQHHSEQRQLLLLSQVKGISHTPHLNATLSTPNLDPEILAHSMSSISVSEDISLLLILDAEAVLQFDRYRPALANRDFTAMPGISNAYTGESYFGYWQYQGEFYDIALSPMISNKQLLGFVVLGQNLSDFSLLTAIEDVSGAKALLILKDTFHSVTNETAEF